MNPLYLGFEKILYLKKRGGSTCSKGKADPLVLAPKWHLAYGGQIQVLGTQLLDPVIEQSAQISYRGQYYKTFYGCNLRIFVIS
jgi:hypothetical protein